MSWSWPRFLITALVGLAALLVYHLYFRRRGAAYEKVIDRVVEDTTSERAVARTASADSEAPMRLVGDAKAEVSLGTAGAGVPAGGASLGAAALAATTASNDERLAEMAARLADAEKRAMLIEHQETELEGKFAALQRHDAELEARFEQLKVAKGDAEKRATLIEHQETELEGKFAALQRHDAELEARLEQLKVAKADAEKRATLIEHQETELEGKFAALQRHDAELEARLEQLKVAKADAEKRATLIEHQETELEGKLAGYERRCAEQEERIARLIAAKEAAERRVAELEQSRPTPPASSAAASALVGAGALGASARSLVDRPDGAVVDGVGAVGEGSDEMTTAAGVATDDAADAAPDDILLIEGIGPKIAAALRADGLERFADIRDASEIRLRSALDRGDISFAPSIPTWSRQAALLASGDRAGFDAYIATLTAGVEPGSAS